MAIAKEAAKKRAIPKQHRPLPCELHVKISKEASPNAPIR
jgi:hypothetical protein